MSKKDNQNIEDPIQSLEDIVGDISRQLKRVSSKNNVISNDHNDIKERISYLEKGIRNLREQYARDADILGGIASHKVEDAIDKADLSHKIKKAMHRDLLIIQKLIALIFTILFLLCLFLLSSFEVCFATAILIFIVYQIYDSY